MLPTSQAKSTAWPIERPDCGSRAYRYDIMLPWINIERTPRAKMGCARRYVRRHHMNAYVGPSSLLLMGIALFVFGAQLPAYNDPNWRQPFLDAGGPGT